jgi:Reverse transcriptase (RNA-dependent DNA polymerase)
MRGVRHIIVEEDMDHPLIGRPVLDEMGFVGSQHLDSVRDKFHLHDFSHIDEDLLEMGKMPLGALSKLLLMPADIPEFIEDLPDVLALAKKKSMKRREQAKLHALDEDQSDVQQGEVDEGNHDVVQSNVKFASLKEQALFYGDIPDDDPIDYYDKDVGQESPEELADAIEGLITSAEQAGMSRDGVQSLRLLVTESKDDFRLKLGADSPANVKPLVIKLRDGAEPVRMSARKYAPPQLKFMRDKIRELEELGLVHKNTGAEWASPPLILPKPGPDQFRMTVDLRVPNASTKPTAWPMPNLEGALHDFHGSEVFATLDFCRGYWQIPLHKDSQDCQSCITPDGVYTPTRVLHATRNATQHLQSLIVVMMDDIKSNIKVWLDDCLLHTKTEDDLLATLNFLFKKCQERGLKLHASKCLLLASTLRYCGRLITKDGVRFDPKNIKRCRQCRSRRMAPTWFSMSRQ